MERERLLDTINNLLSYVESKVKNNNYINLTNINIRAENFFRDLLNLVYGYQLENLNLKVQNKKGIDLGDEINKIAIQVTSNRDIKKIKRSLKLFISDESNKSYNKLIIFLIGKKTTYKILEIEEAGYKLDLKKDVWDIKKLILEIENMQIEKIQEIHDFLKKQIKPCEIGGDVLSQPNKVLDERFIPVNKAIELLYHYYDGGRKADQIDWYKAGVTREAYTYHELILLIKKRDISLYGEIFLFGTIATKMEIIPIEQIPNIGKNKWGKDYETILTPLDEVLYKNVSVDREEFIILMPNTQYI